MRRSKLARLICLTLVFVMLLSQAAFANGGIQGTLMRGNGGAMNGGHVQVYTAAGNSVVGTSTAADGTWAFSLPAGGYKLFLQGVNVFYAPAWWRTPSLSPAYQLGQVVTVADGATQTCDATLPAAATITGTATSGITNAATQATIAAFWYDSITAQWLNVNSTSINGAYTMYGVYPGTYKLSASWTGMISDFYNHKTTLASADTTIIVEQTAVPYSPVLFPVGTPGAIHGVLHFGNGLPAAGDKQYIYNTNGTFLKLSSAAGTDGSWDVTLTPGDYKVWQRASTGHGEGFWRHDGLTPLLSMAETVTVSAGTTTSIEATSPMAGRLTGQVTTKASGSAVPTFSVDAWMRNGAGQWERITEQWSDWHNGQYTLYNLLPGTYRFSFTDENTRYPVHYLWSGQQDLASADDVTLASGQIVTANVALAAEVASETVAGQTRIDTAIDASNKMYPDATPSGHADAVIITNGYNWPDALGGSALAGAANAPVLLNGAPPSAMPARLDAEVVRLKDNGATEAYILGDTNAVSAAVATRLAAIFDGADKVHRLGSTGHSRYATSLDIANVVKGNVGWEGTVFLAKGTDYPDALAASPLACDKGWPIILAESDGHGGLSARVKQFLTANATSKVVILGSENAIPSSMATAAADAIGGFGKIERWYGADRVETAIAVAEHSAAIDLSFDGVGIATAYGYADALCGGPYLARQGNPLLLTADALPLRTPLASKLTSLSPTVATVRFLGGLPALYQGVRDVIVDKLR